VPSSRADTSAPAPQPLRFASDDVPLAGLLYLPAGAPRGALLVCHGAGSRKENHAPMGEQAAAAGLAALTFDFRGHGESGGVMDADGRRDVIAAGETLLRESRAPWLAGRGSSMGGFLLLLAAHERPALFRSLVLLCPADPGSLLEGLDRLDAGLEPSSADVQSEGRFDPASLRPFLETVDVLGAARGLPRVLVAHARDDDAVPFAHSERLAAVLAPPSRFIPVESGGHRAPARSPEVAEATIDWVMRNA
jgi:pimeloyl-ACP methyl ester carboxylesterase